MNLNNRLKLTSYEINEYKRKALNVLFYISVFAFVALIFSLAIRPPPSLPTPVGTFYNLDLKITGILNLQGKSGFIPSGDRQYIRSLRFIIEMPEIPLTVEKKDSEILVTQKGEYNIGIRELFVMRSPKTMNVRVKLNGCRDCYIKALSVSSPVCVVNIPRIILNQRISGQVIYRKI